MNTNPHLPGTWQHAMFVAWEHGALEYLGKGESEWDDWSFIDDDAPLFCDGQENYRARPGWVPPGEPFLGQAHQEMLEDAQGDQATLDALGRIAYPFSGVAGTKTHKDCGNTQDIALVILAAIREGKVPGIGDDGVWIRNSQRLVEEYEKKLAAVTAERDALNAKLAAEKEDHGHTVDNLEANLLRRLDEMTAERDKALVRAEAAERERDARESGWQEAFKQRARADKLAKESSAEKRLTNGYIKHLHAAESRERALREALEAVMAEYRDEYGLHCVDQVRQTLAATARPSVAEFPKPGDAMEDEYGPGQICTDNRATARKEG